MINVPYIDLNQTKWWGHIGWLLLLLLFFLWFFFTQSLLFLMIGTLLGYSYNPTDCLFSVMDYTFHSWESEADPWWAQWWAQWSGCWWRSSASSATSPPAWSPLSPALSQWLTAKSKIWKVKEKCFAMAWSK